MSDGWVKTDRGWRKSYGPPPAAVASGDYPCPRIATDTMPLTEHIDGKFYDSKSAFRRVTKENGCIEVGNDADRFRPVKNHRADRAEVSKAVEKAIAKAGI